MGGGGGLSSMSCACGWEGGWVGGSVLLGATGLCACDAEVGTSAVRAAKWDASTGWAGWAAHSEVGHLGRMGRMGSVRRFAVPPTKFNTN